MLWNVYRDTDNDQTYVQKFDEVKDELEDLITIQCIPNKSQPFSI